MAMNRLRPILLAAMASCATTRSHDMAWYAEERAMIAEFSAIEFASRRDFDTAPVESHPVLTRKWGPVWADWHRRWARHERNHPKP